MGAGSRLQVRNLGGVGLSCYDGSAFFELMISSTAISMTMVLSAPMFQIKADNIQASYLSHHEVEECEFAAATG